MTLGGNQFGRVGGRTLKLDSIQFPSTPPVPGTPWTNEPQGSSCLRMDLERSHRRSRVRPGVYPEEIGRGGDLRTTLSQTGEGLGSV